MNLIAYCTFLLVFLPGRPTDALSCYQCTGIQRVSECNNLVTCSQDESCYQDKIHGNRGHLHNLGCRRNQECQSTPQSIVGRRFLLSNGSASDNCTACCDVETCNRGLCWANNGCMDSHDVDCATVNSLFGICHDINKAKLTCRRFCGLCDVVDGGFSAFSGWTKCDVSCGNGTQSRSRTCTNPAPENGGEDCAGNHLETQSCQQPACPVHGGWSRWSPWGSCSVSCGPGFQRRDRSCSNPYPDQHGDHCYGDSRDDRICTPKACTDGGWSSWITWSSCSVSCGNGIKTRSRDCTNPEPSVYGRYCRGQPNEVTSCNNNRCPDVMTSFTVTSPHSIVSGHLTFSSVIYNLGSNFSPSTGIFTCSKPGVYVFTFILVKKRSTLIVDQVYCTLKKNSNTVIYGRVDPTDDDSDKGSAYAGNKALVHLNKYDRVTLDGCTSPSTSMESWTSFSGFLLYPDA